MGGHSHWAGIKHKKAITDAKKGKIFTKIIKEIAIAAKISGGKPEENPRLRKAMEDARNANMPIDNVKRAIMRGTGQLPGVSYEEIMYEGYGPGGIAVLVEVTTDNRNRVFSEIRKIFEVSGGNLGSTGCVAWMFKPKGCITVKKAAAREEELMTLALDAGAEDFKSPDGSDEYEIITAPADFDTVRKKLEERKIPIVQAELAMLAENEVNVGVDKAQQVVNLMNALEDHDDVQKVHSNFNIPDSILAKLE
ncbi:MAG: YebC/PmpR family DNA-binding transcriptional regulator [Elusimicrobia bacterium]|nr:YebC/PmpR family DNA-binding transcriptional regulator [Elusimicrobiota bacterium]